MLRRVNSGAQRIAIFAPAHRHLDGLRCNVHPDRTTAMFNAVTKKLLTILFLGALLALALQLIHGIVVERQSRLQEVEAGVAAGLGGRQTVVGPMLVVQLREPPPVLVATPTGTLPPVIGSRWTNRTRGSGCCYRRTTRSCSARCCSSHCWRPRCG